MVLFAEMISISRGFTLSPSEDPLCAFISVVYCRKSGLGHFRFVLTCLIVLDHHMKFAQHVRTRFLMRDEFTLKLRNPYLTGGSHRCFSCLSCAFTFFCFSGSFTNSDRAHLKDVGSGDVHSIPGEGQCQLVRRLQILPLQQRRQNGIVYVRLRLLSQSKDGHLNLLRSKVPLARFFWRAHAVISSMRRSALCVSYLKTVSMSFNSCGRTPFGRVPSSVTYW